MENPHTPQRRQRARKACEPCRESKRKCNGGTPCEHCVKFDYECSYRSEPRKRSKKAQGTEKATSATVSPRIDSGSPSEIHGPLDQVSTFARSLESNSGSAFARSFAQTVDPTSKALFPFLGHNIWLGERQIAVPVAHSSIVEILSESDMQDLLNVYTSKAHGCYGFLEPGKVQQTVKLRWQSQSESYRSDAVLCGVAAIGCLFSHLKRLETEVQLFRLAKILLDMSAAEEASIDNVNAWILRTVYLRLTSKPDEAWLSSCIALHAIDAAGLHVEDNAVSSFQAISRTVDPETRRRMFGVARHLNVWLSYDLARSRVVLQNASTVTPSPRPADYTCELLGLLPFTESMDPGKSLGGAELLISFSAVISRIHTEPPSVLAQCNLTLCLYRRLYTLHWKIPPEMVESALSLIERGLQAVHTCIESNSPWHHVAYIPFQSLCALLAIDTNQSFSLLQSAMFCLEAVSATYATKATNDAVAAARALIFTHQRRREADVKRQADLLKLYPVSQPVVEESLENFPFSQAFIDLPWFNDLIPEIDFGNLETSVTE